MILIDQHTHYLPRLRLRKGETRREQINLVPLLNERSDTIDSVSWGSDSSDISVSAHANDSYTATAELVASSDGCANVTLTVTTANGQTIKRTLRVTAIDPDKCGNVTDYDE